jgi:4-hydroxy-tetrahydrodipicolinate synthase
VKYRTSEARRWVRDTLNGYMTVLYTPFREDGEIDEPALRRNVERTLSLPGVGGLSVNSIHQEFWTLTLAERMRLAEIVIEAVAGRAPIVVGVSDTSARNVVELARHAEAAGADLVMVWPPYYGVRTRAGVLAFYEYVAARIGIGMVVYSTTLSELGFYLTPEMVEELAAVDHVCAVQNTTANFSAFAAMIERVGERLATTTSLEEYFLFAKSTFGDALVPNFLIGSSRPVLVQTKAKPYCGLFIEAMRRKDFASAARHARAIMELAEKQQGRYFARGFHHVPLSKYIAGQLGMEVGTVRPPLSAPDRGDIEECLAVLREAGLLAHSTAS